MNRLRERIVHNRKHISLRTKLILSFVFLFVFIFTMIEFIDVWGIPFTTISGRHDQTRQDVFRGLDLVADMKKERLLDWIGEKRDDIRVTADTEFSSIYVRRILEKYHDLVDAGLHREDLWDKIQREDDYQRYLKYLNGIKTTYGIYDRFQIADLMSGVIVLSTDERLLGSNISQNELFRFIQRGNSHYVSDVIPDEQGQHPTIHFAHVVHGPAKEVIAVMWMDVNIDDVLRPLLHTGDGLGRTGEALLVNRDVRIITPLKHPLADGSIAEPLKYRIEAESAVLAARGEEGSIESRDYRGEPVLAVYRHIVVSPEVTWGMVVKRDREELFAPLRREEASSLFVGLTGIVLLVAVTVLVANRITRPILALSKAAGHVAEGNLDARASVTTRDEVGDLAETFNAMVQKVQNWHRELEEAVNERTADLNRANKDLKLEVAERKRSEEKLKLTQFAIDHSSESMFWVGPDAKIIRVNDYACKKLGYSREELLTMTIHDINPHFPRDIWQMRWDEIKESGNRMYESVHRRKDGADFPVEVSANYLAYGDMEYNFTLTRDITERKRIERMKDEFVSTVSHELRTPLTSIHGALGLINTGKVGDVSPKVDNLLRIAERNSIRLKKLIDDILDIQKIESGSMKFNFQPLNLKTILEVSVEDVKSFGEQFKVEFVLDDVKPEMKVRADGDRLKQVMNNLLSNAAKFSPPNGSVEVSMKRRNGSIRVEVRDRGTGIPVEFRDKVFERFTQADSTMTRERGGSGLGLNITKSIIEKHGGHIGFETELKVGTTFFFELPEWKESAGS